MGDALKRPSNLAWMVVLVAFIALSVANVLFLSSCSSGSDEQPEQAQQSTQQPQASEAQQTDQASESTVAQTEQDATASGSSTNNNGIDYLVLVNKTHELDPNWVNEIELVETTNQRGDTVVVESEALAAFEQLQDELASELAPLNATIDLNSCYRSREKQQEIVDTFTVDYGEDYVEQYVAQAGHSEHETGLALDVIPIVDGVELLTNDEMLAQTELWDIVHSTMPKYGFILRYLPDQEAITGYQYEPWHLRYVGTPAAQKIADSGLTLEEYLGEA